MNKFRIEQVAKILSVSKATLRYYDKINIVSPKRGENNYRYYNESDIKLLRYALVIRNAEFTLAETRKIIDNMQEDNTKAAIEVTLEILKERKKEMIQEKEILEMRISTLRNVEDLLEIEDKSEIDHLVEEQFNLLTEEIK